ncbi:MAG: GTPase HflX [Alphaproteobacteria bacterium]|nr:GTPase HflX [Alphaproteobacteria bacterium]
MGQAAVFSLSVNVRKIIAKTFFGSGVIERIKEKSLECEAELLVVDHNLSPVQQRNLEKALNLKVIDRTAVILEIFGRRAKTNEGKLQVELAHLTYQRGRLVRSWTHLERQRGGGGFMGGPGETQIELDRRHIDNRILKIKKELEKVKKTRGIQRSARFKVPFPTVALVGYTNAGKSTLFNQLTKADVMAKDMLFATLDPCMRKLTLEKGLDVILSDTVGFISNLPHELVMAFRGTLEEVRVADIILHVIDVSNEGYKKQVEDVWKVLLELGFTDEELSSKYIEIYNKIDKLEDGYDGLEAKIKNGVCVSAVSGEGCQNILKLLAEKLRKKSEIKEIVLDMNDGKELAKMYEKYEVLKRVDDIDKGVILLLVRG